MTNRADWEKSDMQRQDVVKLVKDLVDAQKRGVLATAGEEGAYASLMAYVALKGGQEIAFATEHDTQKYRNLRRDQDVAMLIDNRDDEDTAPGDIMTVTAIGRVRLAASDRSRRLRGELAERHPRLESFLMQNSCEVFVLGVRAYRVVGRFQAGNGLETVIHGEEL
ncbi:MAG: pyridoxamine 5'-phosphate oxidase family protein [Planctomycetota bacterium]